MIKSIATLLLALLALVTNSIAQVTSEKNAGLALPTGFQASVLAQGLGVARHVVVNEKGKIFIKLDRVKNGGGIVTLDPQSGSVTSTFGNFGGTGIAIKNGYLYASSNTNIYRFKLNETGDVPAGAEPEIIVSGLIDRNQHNSKSITLDNDGNIYVNIGAFSNSCQVQDRVDGSPGMEPCPILELCGWHLAV